MKEVYDNRHRLPQAYAVLPHAGFCLFVFFMALLPLPTLAADKVSVAIPYPIFRIDPLESREPVNRIIIGNISVGLTHLEKHGQIAPELAQGVSAVEGTLQWSFSIREDARFPSTELVTPERIRSSFLYLKELAAKDLPSPEARSRLSSGAYAPDTNRLLAALKNIEKIEVLTAQGSDFQRGGGTSSLVLTLEKSDPDMLRVLALLPIINADIAQVFGSALSEGTNSAYVGPYQIRENRPDKGMLLEAVPEFYRPGIPKSHFVEFIYYADAEEALRALRVGAVDIIALPTSAQLEDIRNDPTLVSAESPLENLSELSGGWKLPKSHWSDESNLADKLLTDQVILRRSLSVDDAFWSRFDLSGTFLP